MPQEIWQQQEIVRWTKILLDSYKDLFGKELIERSKDALKDSENLFHADFVVFSHNTNPDPLYNYANKKGLQLWEMTWEELVKTPSRTTTEPLLREERERLLKQTAEKGFVCNFKGIRISKTGKKYYIKDITLWNLRDEKGLFCGQAATFSQWEKIE
ncbi:MAG: MEKHLA domain-containing protein [Geminocystis sp.]|nr:MEKHLA domain-containing protein [Geminocystis sp.]HIK38626.1 MEKHLA domain-containing protein [Geminocystis sp. M7585_C2015_104]MCS7147690.1 MEKHLA domain-containing protein [Geminocystis sp.]MCX8078467.1 MEKHLA domain-containing protein [Geminocystis sp.]MDW8117245.1 MEKHLA domain-containing protein [Geminocystis sp.]